MVFVEGAANLVASELGASEKDRQRLEEMLRTLEEKEKVVKLLGAYLDTKTEAVRVVIGLDEVRPGSASIFVFGVGAGIGGAVGFGFFVVVFVIVVAELCFDWGAGAGGRRGARIAGGDWAYAAGLSAYDVRGVLYRAHV